MKSSNSSIRLEEIRKKYDTPTRRENKENYARSSLTRKDADQKPFGNTRENRDDKQSNYEMKGSISKRILEEQGFKAKMTSSIFGSRNEMYDSKLFQSNKPEGRSSLNFSDKNMKYEEQAVFKRIKQMKESLMAKPSFDHIKPTQSIIQPKKIIEAKKNSENTGHRVDNIDQINSKIQQILSCLKQNETRTRAYQGLLENEKESSVQDTEISSKTNFTNNEQLRKKYGETGTPNAGFQIRQSASIYQEEKNRAIDSPLQKKINGFRLNTAEQKRESSRTRSFINSVHKQSGETGRSYQLNSGKKLDDEITKIQDKIKHFEEEKKKLNIQFKPFNFSHCKSSSDLTRKGYSIHKDHQVDEDKKVPEFRNCYSKIKTSTEYRNNRHATEYTPNDQNKRSFVSKPVTNTSFEPEGGMSNYSSIKSSSNLLMSKNSETREDFQIKLFPVTVDNKQQPQDKTAGDQTIMKNSWLIDKEGDSINYEEIRRKAQQGIMGRKAKLGNFVSKAKKAQQTKRLISCLGEQAKLDEQFRNNKISFDASMTKNKWEKLEELTNSSEFNFHFTKEQIKSIFTLSDEQNNPFFSVRSQNDDSFRNLIISYVQCQKYWKEHLKGKFDEQKLREQDFCQEKMDLQRKGYLLPEDLVRFLNIETGTFYRNRDLFLIFKRMSTVDRIKFDQLLNTFCK